MLKKCADSGMDRLQLQQIKEGLDFGLSVEEVGCYAKKEFDGSQMNSLRLAIKNRLIEEELSFVTDKRFSGHQMEQVVTGFKEGLTLEQVKGYADEKLTAHEMCKRRLQLLQEMVVEAPGMFSKEYYDDMLRVAKKQSKQMEVLNKNVQDMQEFLNQKKEPDIEGGVLHKQLQEQKQEVADIIRALQEQRAEVERLHTVIADKDALIKILANKKQKGGQKREEAGSFFARMMKPKHPVTIMELMGNPKFSEGQLEQIRLGYEHGLAVDEIIWYAKPGFDAGRMGCMRSVLENGCKGKEQ